MNPTDNKKKNYTIFPDVLIKNQSLVEKFGLPVQRKKNCSSCKTSKSLENTYLRINRKSGALYFQSTCISCSLKRQAEV